MKIIDLNLFLYAVNRSGPRHAAARAWLEETLSGSEPVGIPWAVALGFLRVSTSRRVMPRPLSIEQACAVVDSWFAQPAVFAALPGEEHWSMLRALLAETGAEGNLTTDAHLAALAIERGAELCSTDADFGRFRRLRWTNPLG